MMCRMLVIVALVFASTGCVGEVGFQSECVRSSDCAAGLYCLGSRCGPQCVDDRDCHSLEKCTEGRCVIRDQNIGGAKAHDDFDPLPNPLAQADAGRWEQSLVTWRVKSAPSGATMEQTRKAAQEAFAAWAAHIPISFKETAGAADIVISAPAIQWVGDKGDHGDQCPYSRITVAHAFFPNHANPVCPYGEIHFNTPLSADLAPVMLHEIGHALGLIHLGDPNAIMYAYVNTTKSLTQADIDAIKAVYRKKSGYAGAMPRPADRGWRLHGLRALARRIFNGRPTATLASRATCSRGSSSR
jgi:hypothetical protein